MSSFELLSPLPFTNLKDRTVLITGANRGLGWATAQALAEKGIELALTARNLDRLRQQVKSTGLSTRTRVHLFELDVSNDESIAAFERGLAQAGVRVDALLNNAGIIAGTEPAGDAAREDDSHTQFFEQAPADILRTIDTNALGAARVARVVLPGMKDRGFGRIVNVSSGMGALNEMDGGFLGYRMSKAALNALTRVLHAEFSESGIKINSVCPGWVRTDMGGSEAERSLEEGIFGLVWALTLDDEGPSGGFFRDGEAIDW